MALIIAYNMKIKSLTVLVKPKALVKKSKIESLDREMVVW